MIKVHECDGYEFYFYPETGSLSGPEDKILSPPIGTLKSTVHFGKWDDRNKSVFVTEKPIYAARRHHLRNPMLANMPERQLQYQVLIFTFGQLVWINATPSDIILKSN